MTDSVRDIEREFLRGLNVGVMRVNLAERKIARGRERIALYSLLELIVRVLNHSSTWSRQPPKAGLSRIMQGPKEHQGPGVGHWQARNRQTMTLNILKG